MKGKDLLSNLSAHEDKRKKMEGILNIDRKSTKKQKQTINKKVMYKYTYDYYTESDIEERVNTDDSLKFTSCGNIIRENKTYDSQDAFDSVINGTSRNIDYEYYYYSDSENNAVKTCEYNVKNKTYEQNCKGCNAIKVGKPPHSDRNNHLISSISNIRNNRQEQLCFIAKDNNKFEHENMREANRESKTEEVSKEYKYYSEGYNKIQENKEEDKNKLNDKIYEYEYYTEEENLKIEENQDTKIQENKGEDKIKINDKIYEYEYCTEENTNEYKSMNQTAVCDYNLCEYSTSSSLQVYEYENCADEQVTKKQLDIGCIVPENSLQNDPTNKYQYSTEEFSSVDHLSVSQSETSKDSACSSNESDTMMIKEREFVPIGYIGKYEEDSKSESCNTEEEDIETYTDELIEMEDQTFSETKTSHISSNCLSNIKRETSDSNDSEIYSGTTTSSFYSEEENHKINHSKFGKLDFSSTKLYGSAERKFTMKGKIMVNKLTDAKKVTKRDFDLKSLKSMKKNSAQIIT